MLIEERSRTSAVLEVCCIAAVIIIAAVQAWTTRFYVSSPDGIAYLDIADAYLSGDWKQAVNAYWSPLYSWALALFSALFRPQSEWQFAVMKLANFFWFLAAGAAFELLLGQAMAFQGWTSLSRSVLKTAARVFFLYASLGWVGVHSDTPDMATSAFLFLSTAALLRIATSDAHTGWYALFGASLGFGYLSKSAIFVIAVVCLLTCFLLAIDRKKTARALFVFLLISSPFIAAISITKNRLTFGASGKLNYAWFVHPQFDTSVHWEGGPEGAGTPVHGERKIWSQPVLLEFGSPLASTYPPWYDPSYWWEGLVSQVSFEASFRVLMENARFYMRHIGPPLLLIVLGTLLCGGAFRINQRNITLVLLIPAAAGLGMYALAKTHTTMRYISPFAVLLFLGILTSIRLENLRRARMMTMLATFAVTAFLLLQSARATVADHGHMDVRVAKAFLNEGFPNGESVCIVGDEDQHVRWAKIAGARIVGQIPHQDPLTIDAPLMKKIHSTGAAVLVTSPSVLVRNKSGCKQLVDSGYFLCR